jgi:hypothetical protein
VPFPWEITSYRWVARSCGPERLAAACPTARVESDPAARKRKPSVSSGFPNNPSAQIVLSVSRRSRSRDSEPGTRTPRRRQHRSPHGSPCGPSGASTAAIAFNGAAARPALGPGLGGPLRARRSGGFDSGFAAELVDTLPVPPKDSGARFRRPSGAGRERRCTSPPMN